jgi:hypothetical protein
MSNQTILIEVGPSGVERITSYTTAARLLSEIEPAINTFDELIQSIQRKKTSSRAKAPTDSGTASNK